MEIICLNLLKIRDNNFYNTQHAYAWWVLFLGIEIILIMVEEVKFIDKREI